MDGVVAIRLEYSDNTAIVTVQDNEIGIAPADLLHIFRFYQVQVDRARATGGTGTVV